MPWSAYDPWNNNWLQNIIPPNPTPGPIDWRDIWKQDPSAGMARFLDVGFPGQARTGNQAMFYQGMLPTLQEMHKGMAPWMDFMDFMTQIAWPTMQQSWNQASYQPGKFAPSLRFNI